MSATGITRVAVVGTGLIGASWATCFLASGMEVVATDPAEGAEAALRARIAAQWGAMQAIGLAPGASPDRLRFVATPEEAAAEAGFVQESGPERLDLKRDLFRRLDEAAPEGAVIATSSSTLTASEIQAACARHPGRVVLGHPFNPPHLIPLVEVAGGQATDEAAVARALDFYRAAGKHPIRLRREIRGHVANRLQAALWREALHLVAKGVADVADIDAAIAHGPGLRWALLGPFLNLHLSGGEGGLAALMASPLWQANMVMWRELGPPEIDTALQRRALDGVAAELASHDAAEMVRQRDAVLLQLLRLKAGSAELP